MLHRNYYHIFYLMSLCLYYGNVTVLEDGSGKWFDKYGMPLCSVKGCDKLVTSS